MTGLFRRGGMWWARLVVPERHRAALGRREFVQSCRTHELHIAKLVAAALLTDWRRQLLAVECAPMNSEVLKLIDKAPALSAGRYLSLDAAAASIGLERAQLLRIASDHDLRLWCRLNGVSGHVAADADLERDSSSYGPALRLVPSPSGMPDVAIKTEFSGVLPLPDSKACAGAILADDLEVLDVVVLAMPKSPGQLFIPEDTLHCPVGRLEVMASQVDAVRRHLARGLSVAQVQRAQEAVGAKVASTGAQPLHGGDKLFSEAVEAYCSAPNGLPGKLHEEAEQRQRKKGLMLFAEFMGDLPLREIDAEKLRAFRDGPLRTIPAKSNNLPKELKRATMPETVAALKADGRAWPLMSMDMQRERMQWLARLFTWLKDRVEWLATNPAAPLAGETGFSKAELDARRRDEANAGDDEDEGKRVFQSDELRRIFSQPHYQTGNGAHVTKRNERWYPFEYWLPLLGLLAGCRIKEAAQLHLADVRTVDGVPCLDVNKLTPDKAIKNGQSKRFIPLHPKLIELGFLDYCERLRASGYRRVFPELTWARTPAKYAKEPIRKMSAMLASLGMPRDNTRVFHNFRHNFNGALMRVPMSALPYADEGLKKLVRFSVMGHELGETVNERHYSHASTGEAYALISSAPFDLPPLAKFDIDYAIGKIADALDNKLGERRGREDMGPLNSKVYAGEVVKTA